MNYCIVWSKDNDRVACMAPADGISINSVSKIRRGKARNGSLGDNL